MAYTANTPQASDRISDTQSPILNNFINIPTLIEANHVGFDGSADEGKHKHVSFPEQGASPSTAVNEVALFSRQSVLTGVAELAIRKENDSSVYEFTSRGSADPFWTYLPSGILLRWGTSSGNGDATVSIALDPQPQTIATVIATPMATPSGSDIDFAVRVIEWSIGSPTTIDFYVSKRTTTGVAGATRNFNWLMIGT